VVVTTCSRSLSASRVGLLVHPHASSTPATSKAPARTAHGAAVTTAADAG
jgi:hypothetical protein